MRSRLDDRQSGEGVKFTKRKTHYLDINSTTSNGDCDVFEDRNDVDLRGGAAAVSHAEP
jgi:hypothetical protein